MWALWLGWQRAAALRWGGGRERGQTLTEYALIIMLVVLVVIGALTLFGSQLLQSYQWIVAQVSAV